MSSLKQIEANRRNALKSTGPSTLEGKLISRRNALRHGLTAETVIAELEDLDDYQAFEAAVISDYDAETAVERELVLRLASALWRLRRATGIETALFDSVAKGACIRQDEAQREPPVSKAAPSAGNRPFLATQSQPSVSAEHERPVDPKEDIAASFLRLAELPTFALDRLNRYEYLLWRQVRQIVFTLESSRHRARLPRRTPFPLSFHQRHHYRRFDEQGELIVDQDGIEERS